MEYEQLLQEAYGQVKQVSDSGNNGRFEVPRADVSVVGNKTIICNFAQITSYIRRQPEQLCKFLSKELAAPCKPDNDRLIFNRKISPNQVRNKIELYVSKFVICSQCKKPDTEIIKQDGLSFIHCLACGAKHSLGRA